MNILIVGDVVARPGRRVLFGALEQLRAQYAIDFVTANVENVAGGFGITRKVLDEFLAHGVDAMTSGNHIWDKREVFDFIDNEPRLLRPQNYPPESPGAGWGVFTAGNGVRVGVLNLMGQAFMQPPLDSPYREADKVLQGLPEDVKVVLVDFHAETTSEKMALGWHLDGRVSVVSGTHTHVPTADERLLHAGTAYITDIGMTGCYDSVIGTSTEKVLNRVLRKLPERLEPAKGPATLRAVVVNIDEQSGRAMEIRRITVGEPPEK